MKEPMTVTITQGALRIEIAPCTCHLAQSKGLYWYLVQDADHNYEPDRREADRIHFGSVQSAYYALLRHPVKKGTGTR